VENQEAPMELLDIVGNRYGDLVVEKFSRSKKREGNKRIYFYTCRCDCGKHKEIVRTNLITGHTKSCGCRKNKSRQKNKGWKGVGEISGRTWYHIKNHAVSRKLVFDVTIEQAWELFQKQNGKCALTGIPLSLYSTKRELNSERTASLDRIDSNFGYTVDNIQWVHKEINMMKGTLPNNKFIAICKMVSNTASGKENVSFPEGLLNCSNKSTEF
jgi:hypothetical protein